MSGEPRRSWSEDFAAFFRALSPRERREIDALAARDREFGEDVAAELRAHPRGDDAKGRS
jgi:hypothetical protein